MSRINKQASQLLVQIKKSKKTNKAQNPIKPQKTVGWAFFKNTGFSEPCKNLGYSVQYIY